MTKKALIIGGGPAGCTCTYLLSKKGWKVTLIEAADGVGGLSRTHFYAGHPYEFGPHVWFWPEPKVNNLLLDVVNGEVNQVDRRLYSFNDKDMYRYPLQYNELLERKDADAITAELMEYRDENMKLIAAKLPVIGECTFAEYFKAAVGPTLYKEFMETYTRKMWGITGDQLTTRMVWADRIKAHYTGEPYDPIKFKDETLGEGQPNWYPTRGWNVAWENMVAGAEVHCGYKASRFTPDGLVVGTDHGYSVYRSAKFDAVIWTLHSDEVLGLKERLPANGRVIVPMLVPGVDRALPGMAESLHFSGNPGITRVTEMKSITQSLAPDNGTLLLIEMPGVKPVYGFEFTNVMYHPRCYNHQTDKAIAAHNELVEDAKKEISNIHFCGRHAQFKYWGLPEVVKSAMELCETL